MRIGILTSSTSWYFRDLNRAAFRVLTDQHKSRTVPVSRYWVRNGGLGFQHLVD